MFRGYFLFFKFLVPSSLVSKQDLGWEQKQEASSSSRGPSPPGFGLTHVPPALPLPPTSRNPQGFSDFKELKSAYSRLEISVRCPQSFATGRENSSVPQLLKLECTLLAHHL